MTWFSEIWDLIEYINSLSLLLCLTEMNRKTISPTDRVWVLNKFLNTAERTGLKKSRVGGSCLLPSKTIPHRK